MTGFQPVVGSSILLTRTHNVSEKALIGLFRLKLSVRVKQVLLMHLREESNAGTTFWLFLMPRRVRRVPRYL